MSKKKRDDDPVPFEPHAEFVPPGVRLRFSPRHSEYILPYSEDEARAMVTVFRQAALFYERYLGVC